MKTKIQAIVAAFLITFTAGAAWAQPCSEQSLITVTGDAEVRVVPDEVLLTLGIETWNQNLEAAEKENEAKVQKILQLARKQEIEDKHVQTDHISIEPRYDHQWEHRKFIGYFVRRTIVITLRDLSRFETLLTSALNEGANYVHGVRFQTTELRQHRDKARALAIKAAREKAVALAGELGQKIGRPHSIQEGQAGWDSGYASWRGAAGGMMAQNVMQNAEGDSDSDATIAPGQIRVTAKVTVSFELE